MEAKSLHLEALAPRSDSLTVPSGTRLLAPEPSLEIRTQNSKSPHLEGSVLCPFMRLLHSEHMRVMRWSRRGSIEMADTQAPCPQEAMSDVAFHLPLSA